MDAFSSNDPLQPGPLPYAYLNGEHIAAAKAGEFWKYTFRDHLGTLRLRADYPGTVVSRRDYYPFGGEHTSSSGHETHKFTGQERDTETGLDYFIARHYASNLGRFLQPDNVINDFIPAAPQSMNRYTYGRNNPLRFIDPTGEEVVLFGTTEEERLAELQAIKDALANAKAADLLKINEIKNDDGTSKFVVGVEGGTKALVEAGMGSAVLENRLGYLIDSKQVIGFSLTGDNATVNSSGGGKIFFPGDKNNPNSGFFVGVNPNGIRDRRSFSDRIKQPTLGQVTAHELLGHGFAGLAGFSKRQAAVFAVASENRSRSRSGQKRLKKKT